MNDLESARTAKAQVTVRVQELQAEITGMSPHARQSARGIAIRKEISGLIARITNYNETIRKLSTDNHDSLMAKINAINDSLETLHRKVDLLLPMGEKPHAFCDEAEDE